MFGPHGYVGAYGFRQDIYDHTRRSDPMFVTGQGVRRGLQGNMIASSYHLASDFSPTRFNIHIAGVIKLYILQSRSRIYVLGARKLSAGWMLLT